MRGSCCAGRWRGSGACAADAATTAPEVCLAGSVSECMIRLRWALGPGPWGRGLRQQSAQQGAAGEAKTVGTSESRQRRNRHKSRKQTAAKSAHAEERESRAAIGTAEGGPCAVDVDKGADGRPARVARLAWSVRGAPSSSVQAQRRLEVCCRAQRRTRALAKHTPKPLHG